MSQKDTSLGGTNRPFPETTWGLVTRMKASATAEFREGMETLCGRYWKPIYGYIRIALARSNEDAKDLTQGFLVWLIQADTLRRYAEEKGAFRAYLKVILKRFVKDRDEAMRALKRGGGKPPLSLAGIENVVADPEGTDPEAALDRAWALEAAQSAVSRVRERFTGTERENQFRAYEMYDLATGSDRPSYASIAGKLGVRENDVGNYLYAVRREVIAEIRLELTQTVSGPKDLDREYDELFGS